MLFNFIGWFTYLTILTITNARKEENEHKARDGNSSQAYNYYITLIISIFMVTSSILICVRNHKSRKHDSKRRMEKNKTKLPPESKNKPTNIPKSGPNSQFSESKTKSDGSKARPEESVRSEARSEESNESKSKSNQSSPKVKSQSSGRSLALDDSESNTRSSISNIGSKASDGSINNNQESTFEIKDSRTVSSLDGSRGLNSGSRSSRMSGSRSGMSSNISNTSSYQSSNFSGFNEDGTFKGDSRMTEREKKMRHAVLK